MPATQTSYRFTSSVRLQNRLSAAGVNLRSDDNAGAVDDTIADATEEVLGYTQLLYSPDDLARSSWIEFKTRDIALYYMLLRRNNPASKGAEKQYSKAIKDLEMIQAGVYLIPDVQPRKANIPVLSNQRVQTYPVNHVVNVPGTSSTFTQPEGYVPFNDQLDFLDYSI